MKMLPTIGKYLLVVPLAIFGLGHLANANAMTGMVPSFLPGGVFWVYLTGVCILAGVIGILIGKKAKLAAQLFGLMVVLFAVLVHLPGLMSGNEMSMPMVIKDLSIGGGLWFLSGHLKD